MYETRAAVLGVLLYVYETRAAVLGVLLYVYETRAAVLGVLLYVYETRAAVLGVLLYVYERIGLTAKNSAHCKNTKIKDVRTSLNLHLNLACGNFTILCLLPHLHLFNSKCPIQAVLYYLQMMS